MTHKKVFIIIKSIGFVLTDIRENTAANVRCKSFVGCGNGLLEYFYPLIIDAQTRSISQAAPEAFAAADSVHEALADSNREHRGAHQGRNGSQPGVGRRRG